MNDLSSVLTAQIERFDTVVDPDDVDVDLPDEMSLACTFDAVLSDPEGEGPRVEVITHIASGGLIHEARIEAQEGDAAAVEHIEPGTGLHRAVQRWFNVMWETGDEIPEGTPGEAWDVRARDLLPGDRLVRFDLTVAGVADGGINSAGEPVLVVSYEETAGTDVWPEHRAFTILRGASDHG